VDEPRSDGPGIWVVLLDGYARQDTLVDMGYDNRPFLSELESRGFDVYEDATTNYTATAAVLASALNAATLQELVPEPADVAGDQYRQMNRVMNASAAHRALADAGYQFVVLRSDVDHVAITGDVTYGGDGLTSFEIHLLMDSVLIHALQLVAPDWIASEHRRQVTDTLTRWPAVGGPGRFVLAHVMSPHPPFVFHADGAPRPLPECFPERCSFWTPRLDERAFAAGYVDQVAYLNDRLLEAIDTLPDDAVIVLMSDHGARAGDDRFEHLRTFLAARTPGHERLFGSAPAPLRWLPRVLNTYAGTSLPERDPGRWANWPDPFDLVEVP
jgi:hypothetical protein